MDLVWASVNALSLISDLQVQNNLTDSDYFPVTLELLSGDCTRAKHPVNTISKHTLFKWKDSDSSTYIMYLAASNTCEIINTTNPDLQGQKIIKSIKEAAEFTNMKIVLESNSKSKPSKPWFNSECKNAKKVAQKAVKACFKSNVSPEYRHACIDAKKEYKKTIKTRKLDYINNIKNKFSAVRNSKDFWVAVRKCSRVKKWTKGPSVEDWNTFYANIYQDSFGA